MDWNEGSLILQLSSDLKMAGFRELALLVDEGRWLVRRTGKPPVVSRSKMRQELRQLMDRVNAREMEAVR